VKERSSAAMAAFRQVRVMANIRAA